MTPHGLPGDVLLVNNPTPWWKPSGITSAFIRQRTNSDWSHVATLLSWSDAEQLKLSLPKLKARYITVSANIGDVHVAEAMPSGYIIRPASIYESVPWRVRTWTDPITRDQWDNGLACIEGLIGVPYDWPAMIGFFHRSSTIGDNAKVFCSEAALLVAQACGQLLDAELPARLTPPKWYAECPTPPLRTTSWRGIKPVGWAE